jgi:hypothetical protein
MTTRQTLRTKLLNSLSIVVAVENPSEDSVLSWMNMQNLVAITPDELSKESYVVITNISATLLSIGRRLSIPYNSLTGVLAAVDSAMTAESRSLAAIHQSPPFIALKNATYVSLRSKVGSALQSLQLLADIMYDGSRNKKGCLIF